MAVGQVCLDLRITAVDTHIYIYIYIYIYILLTQAKFERNKHKSNVTTGYRVGSCNKYVEFYRRTQIFYAFILPPIPAAARYKF